MGEREREPARLRHHQQDPVAGPEAAALPRLGQHHEDARRTGVAPAVQVGEPAVLVDHQVGGAQQPHDVAAELLGAVVAEQVVDLPGIDPPDGGQARELPYPRPEEVRKHRHVLREPDERGIHRRTVERVEAGAHAHRPLVRERHEVHPVDPQAREGAGAARARRRPRRRRRTASSAGTRPAAPPTTPAAPARPAPSPPPPRRRGRPPRPRVPRRPAPPCSTRTRRRTTAAPSGRHRAGRAPSTRTRVRARRPASCRWRACPPRRPRCRGP